MSTSLITLIAATELTLRLIAQLEGPDGDVRSRAVERLTEIGRSSTAPLEAGLRGAGWRGREGLLLALGAVGEPALPLLMATARNHPKVDARRLAVRSIGRLDAPAAVDSLMALADGPERDLAAQGLGGLGDARAAPLLRRLLQDTTAAVRRRAVVALCDIVGSEAAGIAIDMMDDSDHGVRSAAANAFSRLGPEGWARVESRLGELGSRSKVLTARAFGRAQDPRAIPVLRPWLASSDWAVRAAAVDGLVRMGETGVPAPEQEPHPLAGALMTRYLEQADGR